MNAIVATGYSGPLTLPPATVAALGLLCQSRGRAVLADGTSRAFDVYAAEVAWDGGWRHVMVSTVGDEALLGMRLIAGHELRIRARPGGAVEIAPLP